jgi:uncharacterized membrane protein
MKTSSNQGHVTAKDTRTQILSQRTTSHLAVDGTKTTPKAKRKALALEFLQPNLVVIQKLLYRLYYLFSSVSKQGAPDLQR